MRLQVWCRERNFGDQLNLWMWPHLIPNFFEISNEIAFFGIGTVLNSRRIVPGRKIVFGSGVGYGSPPAINRRMWTVYAVRGPESARALGIDADKGIADSAVLLRLLDLPKVQRTHRVSFIPHIDSAIAGYLAEACAMADIHYIDPRQPPDEVINDIRASEILLCEAMHGAIVADAMRVPWIPISTAQTAHAAKWNDWGASLGVNIKSTQLYPKKYKVFVSAIKNLNNLSYNLHNFSDVTTKLYCMLRHMLSRDGQDPEIETGRSATLSWIGPTRTLRPFPGFASEIQKPWLLAYREQRLRTIFANTTGPTLPALLAERFRNILRNQEASLSAPEAIDMVTEKLVDELEHMKREVF